MKYQDDVSDEAKPKFLSATGNDNPDAQPEVLVCSRGLKSFGLGGPTARQITIGNASSKTTFFPDGDTFTGVASSSENDIVVYTYFNEPVAVQGTPQLGLNDASDLTGSIGLYQHVIGKSSFVKSDAGIVAFGLDAVLIQEHLTWKIIL